MKETLKIGDKVEVIEEHEGCPVGAKGTIRKVGTATYAIEITKRNGFQKGHKLDGLLISDDGWNIDH